MKKSFLKYITQYGTPGRKNAHIVFRVPGDEEAVAFNIFRRFAFMNCVQKVSSEASLMPLTNKPIALHAAEIAAYYELTVKFREEDKYEDEIVAIVDKIKMHF